MLKPEKQSKVVLHVDDDLLNLQLVRRTLSRIGYEVIEAMDAKSGISKAEELLPDLILMDLNMPDIDGFEAVRLMREKDALRSVPIIMITADHTLANPRLSREAGCNAFLYKPIRYTKLVETVQDFLAQAPDIHNANA